MTVFVTVTCVCNFISWLLIFFVSAVEATIWEPMLSSLFRSNCTSSGLLSLFKTSSVWVPTIEIDTLKQTDFFTYKIIWLSFAAGNLLFNRNTPAIVKRQCLFIVYRSICLTYLPMKLHTKSNLNEEWFSVFTSILIKKSIILKYSVRWSLL